MSDLTREETARLRDMEARYLAGEHGQLTQTLLHWLRREQGDLCYHGCGRTSRRVAAIDGRARAVCRHSSTGRPCGVAHLLECTTCKAVVRSTKPDVECCRARMVRVPVGRCACVADATCRYCTAREYGRAKGAG